MPLLDNNPDARDIEVTRMCVECLDPQTIIVAATPWPNMIRPMGIFQAAKFVREAGFTCSRCGCEEGKAVRLQLIEDD